jgi:B9 domain-containing protein 1
MLYGTDFFGRSILQGYGNIHLPTGSGQQKRKIRIFKPLPQSVISGIFGYLGGVVAEYKDP